MWDPSDRELLVYGGTNTGSSVAMGDLWAYHPGAGGAAGSWTQLQPSNAAPAGRFGAAGAWDAANSRLLIFGGQHGSTLLDDVEAYSPSANTWTTLSPDGAAGAESPRTHASAVWDGQASRLLLFGGKTATSSPPTLSNEMWAFAPGATGGAWSLLDAGTGAVAPAAREWAPAAWDTSAGVLRLFGGKDADGETFSDTWEWSATGGWRFDEARTQPSGRGAAAAAWDDWHARFIVGPGLGLNGDASDTWAYDPAATAWAPLTLSTAVTPTLRQMTAMAWDDADGQALFFGGRVSGTGAANDLWALAPATPNATPTPSPTPAAVQKALDVGWVLDNDGNLLPGLSQEVNYAKAAGAALVRIDFRLGSQTSWTQTLLGNYGQAITMFKSAGIGVIGLVSAGATTDANQADWTANNHENNPAGTGDNTFLNTTYTAALTTLISYFHGNPYDVKLWELWNEPNVYSTVNGTTYTGASYIYPSNFAALLLDSYQAIKKRGGFSDVSLISGGIFGQSAPGGAYDALHAGAAYLTSTYQQGIAVGGWATFQSTYHTYPLDDVGQHIYVDQGGYTAPATVQAYEDWLRGAYTAFEGADTSKNTIVTEAGWTTGGGAGVSTVSTDQQAANLDALYWAAKAVPYTPIVTWFQLQDNPAANLYFGLYDPSWNPKPALARYQAQ